MKRLMLCLLLVVGLAGGVSAQVRWDGDGFGDGWHTAENWNPDGIPGGTDWCFVAGGGNAVIDADVNINRLTIAWWGEGNGSVTINSGDVTLAGHGVGIGQANAAYTGELTINGGSLTLGGWGLYVGYQNGTGILNMNAGMLDCNGTAMKVGFGTWSAAEVTKGYVYLHGGTIKASALTLTDQSASAPGTQEGKLEFDGSGKLILDDDVVDFINGEIGAGRITAVGSQTVVATYSPDTQKTTVEIPEPATLVLLSCGLGLIARKRR